MRSLYWCTKEVFIIIDTFIKLASRYESQVCFSKWSFNFQPADCSKRDDVILRDRSLITSQEGGAVVSEESGKIKFLLLHNNLK